MATVKDIKWKMCLLYQEKQRIHLCAGESNTENQALVQAYITLSNLLQDFEKAKDLHLPINV